MSSTQLIVLALFATVIFGIYNIVPVKHRSVVLLLASYGAVFAISKFLICFLLITTLTVWVSAYYINRFNSYFEIKKVSLNKDAKKSLKAEYNKKKKAIMLTCLFVNLLILLSLKYINFFGGMINKASVIMGNDSILPVFKVVLPLGISYYTLQAIGYLVDVYRGKYKAVSLYKVALFIGFFPQLLEGPIGTYDELGESLSEGHVFDKNNVLYGLELALWGFIKKIVIADRINIIVAPVFSNYQEYSGIIILGAVILFTFQLYAEFSGIIEMVTGISRMYGIKLAKNFDQPFFAKTVSEFWRRWHISLGTWFKNYVFYPISTSNWFSKLNKRIRGKVGKLLELFVPLFVSLLPVWLLTGLWHGASWKYVVYGLYYFVVMMIGVLIKPIENKLFKISDDNMPKWFRIFAIIRTFILVNIGMLIFRAENVTGFFAMFGKIFTSGSLNIITTANVEGIIDIKDFVLLIAGIVILIILDAVKENKVNCGDIGTIIVKKNIYLQIALCVFMALVLIVFGAYGNGYLPVDPIYGGF